MSRGTLHCNTAIGRFSASVPRGVRHVRHIAARSDVLHIVHTLHVKCLAFFPFLHTSVYLQLIPDNLSADVRHSHDLYDQACPASEVLSPLTLTRLGVVLLPCEAGLLPAFINGVDEIIAEVGVQLLSMFLVWALGLCDILRALAYGAQ